MKRYNPAEIEEKWQKYWDQNGTYTVDLHSDKPTYYGFGMFNYPSGAGIHLGHTKNFTIPDILMRFKRQNGYEAYSPVGFDSFGLPAENYAIKTGQSPRQTTDEALASYRIQYRKMGWSMDWTKEIDTSKADYYKWTQWCFLQLHKEGLAYQKESLQWWCDLDKSVLSDEQVINGKCWRHDNADDPLVTKKSLRQWFFKITDYADEILDATDDLDWTPWVKTAQKNWIGRSEGAKVKFKLEGLGVDNEELEVFTTAYDTIFGVTFMVLAPEHPLVNRCIEQADNSAEVKKYVADSIRKSDIDREKEKTKTGVELKGLTATNPANGEQIPLWIADYVLMGYGTGAVMAVPGEDERDYEFANKYNLPVVYTTEQQEFVSYQDIKADPSNYTVANSQEFDGLTFDKVKPAIMDKLESDGSGATQVNYKVRDWLISRQRYWGAPIPVIHCGDCGAVPVPEKDLPVELPELDDYHPSGDGRSPLAKATEWLNVACPECGKGAERETDTMDGYVCSSWYQMRYLSPNDDTQAWDPQLAKKWMSVDFYNGGDHATAHLLYARFFTRFFYKQGLVGDPEPFKKMYFHAKILAEDGAFFSKSKGNGIDPLEVINSGYGADALRTYMSFIAPPDVESPWNNDGLPSCYRFINRIWTLVQEYNDSDKAGEGSQNAELLKATHKAISKVSSDIESIKYNTAISTLMATVNSLYKIKDQDNYSSESWQTSLESLVCLVAPFAPHVAEELWSDLGHEDSVNVDHWPELDEKYLVEDTLKLAVQVNGKVRAEIEVSADTGEDEIMNLALSQENVAAHLAGKEPKKVIYVKGRLVSVVV
ncbi:MAG: leucyl-tRNA synthetase [Candidatus Saccharimonadales bacterium]|jgi:leucyl-tRNA synthetase